MDQNTLVDMQNSEAFDCIVIGAGPVGMTAALALSRQQRRVALIEKRDLATAPNPPLRALALSYTSLRFLADLGLGVATQKTWNPVECVLVSKEGMFGSFVIDHEDIGEDYLGKIVPLSNLMEALFAAVSSNQNCKLFSQTTAEAISPNSNGYTLEVLQGKVRKKLETKLLIIANGPNSKIAQKLGYRWKIWNLGHSSVVCIAHSYSIDAQTSHERFISDGLLATVPLNTNSLAIICCRKTPDVTSMATIPEQEFIHYIQAKMGKRIPQIQHIGKREITPLMLSWSSHSRSGPSLLLGNASRSFYPSAAQNFNLSLRDIALLANLHKRSTKQPYSRKMLDDMLREYTKKRRIDVLGTIFLTSILSKIFTSRIFPLRLAAQSSLVAAALSPNIRRLIAKSLTFGFSSSK